MRNIFKRIILVTILLIPIPTLAEVDTFQFNNEVALNMVRGEISAPIETTRFQDDRVLGQLTIDLSDLTKTRGIIKVDLLAIQSHTFGDPSKNVKQTEHMKNWFEIGADVTQEKRKINRYAIFDITKINSSNPKGLSEASPLPSDKIGTARAFQVKADGTITVHGITKPKTVDLDVVIYDINPEGEFYKEAKRLAIIKSKFPLQVSLKEHGVKPRDTTGKFLAKALNIIGLKIADIAEISFDLRAYQPREN